MEHFCLITIDADRDYPVHIEGKIQAKSFVKQDTPLEPSVEATTKGLEIFLDLLEEFDIKACFFIEASILPQLKVVNPDILNRLRRHDLGNHGFSHEDLTGQLTGVRPEENQIHEILQKAIGLTETYLGKPLGFRAPYLNFNQQVAKVVSELFTYDSSITLKQAKYLDFYPMEDLKIPELPLITTRDGNGKPISTYLWQLLEGNRPVEDYLRVVDEKRADPNFPFTIFALHPWHIVYHIGKRRMLEWEELEHNRRNLRRFLQEAGPFGTVEDALNAVREI